MSARMPIPALISRKMEWMTFPGAAWYVMNLIHRINDRIYPTETYTDPGCSRSKPYRFRIGANKITYRIELNG
jgi:hypothetical protein